MSDAATAPAPTPDTTATAPQSTPTVTVPPGIDIEQLTEKVYRLLLADLRQEQMRRGGKW